MLEPETQHSTGPDSRTLKHVGIGAAVVAIALVGVGIATRINANSGLKEIARAASVPIVTVVSPTVGEGREGLVLPGNVQAYNSAAINARTNGYVRRWLADIGDHVQAGETLAVLDAPEIEQRLAQAKADYQTALANQRLAATTAKRWQAMLAQDAVSQQEVDEKAGDLAAKTALSNASLASVRELNAMQGFTRLAAPFSGVVTSRSAQIGALVVAGNAASQPLFTISDVHRVRIYVRVPQVYSSQIRPGMEATFTLPEYPGRDFTAKLTRSANSVDAQSGAMLVELQADNGEGALKPGAYAHVKFPIDGGGSGLRLPGSAILSAEEGPSVALVGKGGRVILRRITIARDEGKTVLVSVGLKPGDKVIDSPPDSVQAGDRVQIAAPTKGAQPNG